MARLAVLRGQRSGHDPAHRLLEAAGHHLEAVPCIEALARRWPRAGYELLLIDQPRPLLALHRLQRRLRSEPIAWSRFPVLHLGDWPEIGEGDFLLCHCQASEPSEVPAAVEALLRLAGCLAAPDASPPQNPAPAGAVEAVARRLREQLLATVEQRDAGLPGHARRVEALATALGRRLGFDSAALLRVAEAALWHDVGKLALAPGLLAHPRRLAPDQRAAVRHHARWGEAVVCCLTDDRQLAGVVGQHHERRDGSGYLGLSAEQILPEARVIAIAEVWDALTSAQLYRPALEARQALEELRREPWGEELDALEEEVAARSAPTRSFMRNPR